MLRGVRRPIAHPAALAGRSPMAEEEAKPQNSEDRRVRHRKRLAEPIPRRSQRAGTVGGRF